MSLEELRKRIDDIDQRLVDMLNERARVVIEIGKLKNIADKPIYAPDREKEILQLLAEGKSNKEVASLLDLSVYTVETHRANLMQRLGLHSTAEIVLYAVRKKIIS
jgi:DNA-binding NarL/FixJ family response regulator